MTLYGFIGNPRLPEKMTNAELLEIYHDALYWFYAKRNSPRAAEYAEAVEVLETELKRRGITIEPRITFAPDVAESEPTSQD